MRLRRELAFFAQITGLLAVRNAVHRHIERRAPYRLAAFMGCVDNWKSADPDTVCTGYPETCGICPLRKHGGLA